MTPATLAQLNEKLVNDPSVRNCRLKAEFIDGKLVVIGKVRSYYLKQKALHLARQCASADTYILTTEIVVEWCDTVQTTEMTEVW